ncbi:MAG: ATP-binding protein [Planctomycetes bacterium]|nr:ATP-binding protein [Planctomycetota bacterium]
MKRRQIEPELRKAAGEYPVVTVIGPRQSGKTTLARMVFPDHTYVNLEHPEHRRLATSDPKTFLHTFAAPAIFDGIQNVPELLSWIQVTVDENPKEKGLYILTGSHQMKLRDEVSQSLAGRTALLTLLPFSLDELTTGYGPVPERETLLLNGFLPRIHEEGIRPLRAWRDYYQTYVERDVRKMRNIENQSGFEQFLKLLAGRAGRELNLQSISGQIGVSSPTLKQWLSVLEASFLVFRLPPFFNNFGKRLTKSPKIYFLDTGLLCYLLNIETSSQLERDPLFGNIFENMVVMEFFKYRHNMGAASNLHFFRDHNQNEVDLIYPHGSNAIPIEIKSSRTWNERFAKGVAYFQKISGQKEKGIVVYDGELEFENDQCVATNFRTIFSKLQALIATD